jgi:hypothetical protein
LPTVFYTNDLKNKVAEENRQLREDMKKLKVEGRIQLKNLRELKIYRGISVGKYGVYEGVMNIRDYPIVPFINEMGTRFADSQGDIESIEGIQKAENKFYLLTMHNAMLTGNMRFMGPKNAVKDKTKFQRSASVPGAYLDYEPDGTLPNGGAPTIIQPGQLSSAFYTLSQDLIEKAKFITSVYSPTLGDPSGTPETFSTAASLQNLGTQTIKELARRWEVQIAKIGEVALQFIQNYTDEGELLEFVDMESGQVKSPMAEQDTESGEQVDKPIVLNQLITKEGVIHEIKNNTRLGKYAVKVLSQPNFGSDRLAKAAFLKDMLMNKAIPPTAAVIALLADLMEIPGGQKLIDEIQKDTGAQSQLAQLAKQMKDMQNKLKRLDSDNTKLMKELEIADFRNDLDKTHRDIKDKAKERIDSIIPEGDGQ